MVKKLLNMDPQRRTSTLNAALKEFALRGFDNASTNKIAKDAGISKALMFHYVKNKQELFLAVYDYFFDLLDAEYFAQIDFSRGDIFEKLRQSYLLQIRLAEQYPWVFELNKLSATTNSDELNEELKKYRKKRQTLCDDSFFDSIDTSRLRTGMDVEKCKQLIYWSNLGFTNQLLDEIKNSEYGSLDYELIAKRVNDFLDGQKSIFYKD